MQHIVEKEQEIVDGQQAESLEKATDKGESLSQDISTINDQKQHTNIELISPEEINDTTVEKDALLGEDKINDTEKNGKSTNTPKVNGTSQNGGTVHGVTNCQNNPLLDELEDIDEDDCDDALHESCKVDGKFTKHLCVVEYF